MNQKTRVVLKQEVVDALRGNANRFADTLFPSAMKQLKEGFKERIVINCDVLGLNYTEIFDSEGKYYNVHSYFFEMEFDKGSFKIENTFVDSVYKTFLEGLAVLLNDGLKTFFFCHKDAVELTAASFCEETIVGDHLAVIPTSTPAKWIIVESSTMQPKGKGIISWKNTAEEFPIIEQKYLSSPHSGLQILSGEQILDVFEKVMSREKDD